MKDKRNYNIVMLLYNHFPNDNRPRKEAKSINRAGFNLTVFCLGFPQGPRTEIIYNGNNHIKIRRLVQATAVSRIKPFNMLIFWIKAIIFGIRENKITRTIIHSHDLTALPAGCLLSLFLPSIHIYDSHELFPETAKIRLGSLFGAAFLVLEKLCFNRVDFLIGVTLLQLTILKKRCRAPAFPIPNYPSIVELPESKKKLKVIKKKRRKVDYWNFWTCNS